MEYKPLGKMNRNLIIGFLVVIVILIILVLVMGSPSSTTSGTTAPTVPVVTTPTGKAYTFYSNKDSNANDIVYRADLANNIPGLKSACDVLTACKGFNTNGYLKNTIASPSSWTTFGNGDTTRGLYVVS